MSETAQTLVEAALRTIGVIASGETANADELADGLEAMRFMIRHWSDKNIRIYAITLETITLSGASSYTIGTGGDINTGRPSEILSADADGDGIEIIDRERYERITINGIDTSVIHFWYNPTYPLGTLYVYPTYTGSANLRSIKPLTEPSVISATVQFPPGYDECIKWNLALRLAPEYEKEPSSIVMAMAASALNDIETRNFASQMVGVRPEIIKISNRYDIDQG